MPVPKLKVLFRRLRYLQNRDQWLDQLQPEAQSASIHSRWIWLDAFAQDTKIALRGMRRNPGYALLGAGTLAIAMGACTAVFTLAHAVLIRPLPYREPERLVGIWHDLPSISLNHAQTTAGRFQIRGIPTVIVFSGGREVARQTGAVPLAGLEQLLTRAQAGRG